MRRLTCARSSIAIRDRPALHSRGARGRHHARADDGLALADVVHRHRLVVQRLGSIAGLAMGSRTKALTLLGGSDQLGTSPSWAPDATQIAFTKWGDIFVTSPSVYEKSLTSTGNNANPAWAPDGTRIAFVSSREGRPEIYLMKVDGSDVVRLTYDVGSKIGRPAWSPDSDRIAFNCEVDLDNQDICIINRDGSGLARVTSNSAADADPAWSADGAKIAFSTARFDGVRLVFAVMSPDGSQATQIGSGIGGWGAAWSPDGTRIAFASFCARLHGLYSEIRNLYDETRWHRGVVSRRKWLLRWSDQW